MRKTEKRVNPGESPLARLYLRRRNGVAYITDHEFQAGERLRHDFERGQLQPRLSSSPETALRSGTARKHAPAARHAVAELSDSAIDARARLNRAIGFLGAGLSGVALDICCFLKGFEQVERERQWPPRSAKLMLKTALSRLVDHYGLENARPSAGRTTPAGRPHAWGDGSHRPALFPDDE